MTDVPTEITLSPTSTTVRVDEIQTFTVTLDVPAPRSTGTVIDLMEDTGGMIPGSVTVPGDALSATFDYQAPASIEPEIEVMGTLTATLNSTTPPFERAASLTVLPPLPGTVILNEIDYDQPSTDGAEYIELYNPGATPADLTNLQLVLVNGGSTPPSDYQIIDLRTAYPAEEPSPELPAGAYLVVRASETMTSVPEGTLTISFSSSTNQVQNGAPDGVAVYDTSTMTLVDALSYEGSITAAQFGGMTFDLVEGAATPAEDSNSATGSISRLPDGDDTNDAANDWSFTPCLTPGEPNLASCP